MPRALQRWMKDVMRLAPMGRLTDVTQVIRQALAHPAAPRPTGAQTPDLPSHIDGRVTAVEAPCVDAVPLARPCDDEDGRTSSGEHREAGLTRHYRLYVPPATSARPVGTPLPLVVMLHGCTQNPADFALGTGMNTLARERGFAVLYPAQSDDANPQRCWNWFSPKHQQRGHGEAAVLAGMTRSVVGARGFDARRVYVAGLSAGGAMAAILGQAYPDVYAAVGNHSGLASGAASDLMSALSVMKNGPKTPGSARRTAPGDAGIGTAGALAPRPTIVFHGDADALVHPGNGGQAIAAALGAAQAGEAAVASAAVRGVSAQGRHYTRTVYASVAGAAAQAEHWVVHGGGHAWSGGNALGSYTDPAGPDATHEMWRFFSDHAQAA